MAWLALLLIVLAAPLKLTGDDSAVALCNLLLAAFLCIVARAAYKGSAALASRIARTAKARRTG